MVAFAPQNVAIGVSYIVVSICLFILNSLLLWTTFHFKEYCSTTYRIIKSMCIACLIELVVFFYTGVAYIWDQSFNYTLELVAGAALQSSYILYISLSLTLAIDRVTTFTCVHIGPKLSYFLLFSSWLHGFAYFVTLCFPLFHYTLCDQVGCYGSAWFYTDYDFTRAFMEFHEPIMILCILSGVLLCYFIVFWCLIRMRRIGNGSRQISSFHVEIRIVTVAIISFIYEVLNVVLIYEVLNVFYAIDFLPRVDEVTIVINYVWMFDTGLFCIATIAINTSIRGKLLSIFPRKPSITVTLVTNYPTRT
ncbi:hypothetical protein QR680_016462 [Steinernema hermaphroditum]|uniref:Uncharacterized protein n=1 Tax=Steinernema hermaphroditum TaxID=289476 RepID=A0AA39LM11_9BILA|nr:hypothetical protein QR680_016462 [Steinernema hermaphroditum]